MKTGFFLTARLGSSRLPKKHLLEASGKSMIEVLGSRILGAFGNEIRLAQAIVTIVTSDEPENREFERLKSSGIGVFYGSRQNIPLRHLQAARALGVEAIVAVDGDDILCSTDAMRIVLDGLLDGHEYVKTSGLPLGMNSFGYRRDFLERSLRDNEAKVLETGWGFIFDSTRLVDRPMRLGLNEPDSLRFTLDYPEDYLFFKSIIEHFGEQIYLAGDRAIVASVLEKGLNSLTEHLAQKYWSNFNSLQAQEMSQTKQAQGGEK